MKRFLISAVLFLSLIIAKAQTTPLPPPQSPPDADGPAKVDTADHAIGGQDTEFPGGIEKFALFIKRNFKMPAGADNITGKVIVSFVVEKDGSVTQIKIARGLRDDIDTEVIRVIGLSPKWKPGMQLGNPVRVAYTVPIHIPITE